MTQYLLTDGQLAELFGAAWSAARGKKDTPQYPLVAQAWILNMLARLAVHGPVVHSDATLPDAIAGMRHWDPKEGKGKVVAWKKQA